MSSSTIATFRCPEWIDEGKSEEREIVLEWRSWEGGGFVVLVQFPNLKLTGQYEGCIQSEEVYRHQDHDKALSRAVKLHKKYRAEYNAELQAWITKIKITHA